MAALTGAGYIFWFDFSILSIHIFSGALYLFILYLINVFYKKIRDLDGIGGGDIKLAGAAGIWLGPAGFGPWLLLSSLLVFLAIGLRVFFGGKFASRTPIPFGAFLAFSLFCLWCLQAVSPWA